MNTPKVMRDVDMGFEPIYPVLQTGASVPSWLIDIKRRRLDLHQSRVTPATCFPDRCRPYPDRHPPNYVIISLIETVSSLTDLAYGSLYSTALRSFSWASSSVSA